MSFAKRYIKDLTKALKGIDLKQVEKLAKILEEAYLKDKKIFVFGNGGSAASASHFVCDLGKGTVPDYDKDYPRFKVYCLNDNASLITAYGNDLGYDKIFSQQLKNLVSRGDIVIGITGSGNSKNAIDAFEVSKMKGAFSVGLLGFGGGKCAEIVDLKVHVKSDHYGQVESAHMTVLDIVAYWLMERVAKLNKVSRKLQGPAYNN